MTKWVALAVVLAVVNGGWLAFDGTRALVEGDYVTLRDGPHAGELGPWADVLQAVGVEPRSPLVKAGLAGYGAAQVGAALALAVGRTGAATDLRVLAGLGLWILPVGTVLNAAQLVLLRQRRPDQPSACSSSYSSRWTTAPAPTSLCSSRS